MVAGVTLLERALLNRDGSKVAFARCSPRFAQPGGASLDRISHAPL